MTEKAVSGGAAPVRPATAGGSDRSSVVFPDVPETGLTRRQAEDLLAQGRGNSVGQSSSRGIGRIIRDNVLTLFNGIMFTCLVAVLITGQWQDAAFSVIAIINTAIGTIAEIHAKRLLDRLTILIASKPFVRRDGQNIAVDASSIVPGDLVWLRSGEQVPADVEILRSWGAEIDESMITGESRSITKKPGDKAFSGSTLVSGMALARVGATGAGSYAARLTAQAKVYKKVHSDLQDGINKILKGLVWVVVPLSVLLLVSQLALEAHSSSGSWQSAVISTVAGVVSLIPQGLVLLTSINFALSAIRLAQKKVLIQQLNSIETLARVDSLNLDKTGTITDGGIMLEDVVPCGQAEADAPARSSASPSGSSTVPSGTAGASSSTVPAIGSVPADVLSGLRLVVSEESPNATGRAVLDGLSRLADDGVIRPVREAGETARIPFSSERKWSAVLDGQGRAWVLGAPQFVLPAEDAFDSGTSLQGRDEEDKRQTRLVRAARAAAATAASQGSRVLVLVRVGAPDGGDMDKSRFLALKEGGLPANGIRPVALVLCSESIRPQAQATLAYFRSQDVRCRIVSGDDPRTVAAIARKVDLLGDGRAPRWMDARDLKSDPAGVAEQIEDVDVLGRVLPDQKKLIVQAQHLLGRTVGMTGDGVNDTLAIKEADFGIAMGNAAPATKSVADAVLIDSDFSHLPEVVGQGRRVMANMERVASLFLVKTFYSIVITLGTVLLAMRFPYLPRHMSYISPLCIGIPAFILSLPPNNRRYRPGFLTRVLRFSIPAGLAIGLSTIIFAKVLPWLAGWDPKQVQSDLTSLRTCVAMALFALSLLVLAQVSRPLRSWRGLLVLAMAGLGVAGGFIPPVAKFFRIIIPDDLLMRWILLAILAAVLLFLLFEWLAQKLLEALWWHREKNPLRLHWWGRREVKKQRREGR